jgi:predicted acyltransferase
LDQFRGYTMAGMILVNFIGGYHEWVHPVLLHHHTYCSYADTIMPQFLFAVGFAMRLSFGRHVQAEGLMGGYLRMVRRILGLFLVAIAIYTEGRIAESWQHFASMGPWDIAYPFLKRHWLQTLGQIALTSLWILPVIRAGAGVRIGYMVFSGAAHVALSHWFNYHWVNTDPNGIDGGPLGFLTWAVPTLLGTLTCDMVLKAPGRAPLGRLLFISVLVMGLGYVFSCGTRLYDLSPTQRAQLKEAHKQQDAERHPLDVQIEQRTNRIAELSKRDHKPPVPSEVAKTEIAKLTGEIRALRAQLRHFREVKLAPSPVIPPREAWVGRTWKTLLAEPPFVSPPEDDPKVDPPPHEMHRYWNYWMMTQRGGALSYTTFGAGFSLLVYILFYMLGDMAGIRIGIFRTLGTNALAAYVLASIIGGAVKTFIPGDAPPWYVVTGFCVDFFLIWLFVRTLEKNNIYLRV